MENAVDLEPGEMLQVENLLLKIRLANSEIERQRSIVNDVNRSFGMIIGALRSKYKLDDTWRLDIDNFKFVKTEQPPEMGLPVKVPVEPEETVVS
jgi:hypothetical protein